MDSEVAQEAGSGQAAREGLVEVASPEVRFPGAPGFHLSTRAISRVLMALGDS